MERPAQRVSRERGAGGAPQEPCGEQDDGFPKAAPAGVAFGGLRVLCLWRGSLVADTSLSERPVSGGAAKPGGVGATRWVPLAWGGLASGWQV